MFVSGIRKVCVHQDREKEAITCLLNLQQGSRSVVEYSVEFSTLAVDSGWKDTALQEVFINSLSENLKDELTISDISTDQNSLISPTIKLDNCLRERRLVRASCPSIQQKTSASLCSAPPCSPSTTLEISLATIH